MHDSSELWRKRRKLHQVSCHKNKIGYKFLIWSVIVEYLNAQECMESVNDFQKLPSFGEMLIIDTNIYL